MQGDIFQLGVRGNAPGAIPWTMAINYRVAFQLVSDDDFLVSLFAWAGTQFLPALSVFWANDCYGTALSLKWRFPTKAIPELTVPQSSVGGANNGDMFDPTACILAVGRGSPFATWVHATRIWGPPMGAGMQSNGSIRWPIAFNLKQTLESLKAISQPNWGINQVCFSPSAASNIGGPYPAKDVLNWQIADRISRRVKRGRDL